MSKGNVLIIGGGPTGCAAAWEVAQAGYKVTIVEQHERLGGMASAKRFNGNVFEYGTHVFHTDQPELLARVKDLMGAELFEIDRGSNIHIKYQGRYFAYPLQGGNLLRNLSKQQAVLAALSFMKSFVYYEMIQKNDPKNTEEYLIQKFGTALYETFFRDYTKKVWGVSCAELDACFGAQRIPRSDILSSLKKILDKLGLHRRLDHPLSESVIGKIYYTEQGVAKLFETIGSTVKNLGATIYTGTTLKKLVVGKKNVRKVVLESDGREITLHPDFIVVTIPLPVLVECFDKNIPHDVLQAGRSLNYRAISLTGLLVQKKQVRPAFFTYYPKLTFNRLSEPTNHGLKVEPEDHTLLIAETVCAYDDDAYRGEKQFRRKIIDEIVQENLVRKSEIAEVHSYKWRYAYPLYTIGFKEKFDKVYSFLESLDNIYSTGRHGMFQYVNMHVAMKMGIESLIRIRHYMHDNGSQDQLNKMNYPVAELRGIKGV